MKAPDENAPIYQRASCALRWLSQWEFRQDHLDFAAHYCRQSPGKASRLPDRTITASDLGIAAAIAAQLGQSLRAATLPKASKARYARQKRKLWEVSSLDTVLAGWQVSAKREALTQTFERGQRLAYNDVVAFALDNATTWAPVRFMAPDRCFL